MSTKKQISRNRKTGDAPLSHETPSEGRVSFHPQYRPTWIEINTDNFEKNFKAAAALVKPRTGIIAVVKADAYGHSAAPLSRCAARLGAAALGVSSIEEGIALRRQNPKGKILILGSMYPLENLAAAVEYQLTPTIASTQGLAELVHLAARFQKRLPFHLKVDTGMGRVGVAPASAARLLEKIAARKEVLLDGIYMHFAAASDDKEYTAHQFAHFLPLVKQARRLGLSCSAHAANSAALLRWPKTRCDLVRPGIMLYGLLPYQGAERDIDLLPVLSWKTRIVFLKKVPSKTSVSYDRTFVTKRPSVIATLPVGYADGYRRALSNRGYVLVGGQRCPVVGRVTMDMIMADVTGVPGVSIGDEAVLIGSQGAERISAEEMAQSAGTITYEITCGITQRVPRLPVSGKP